MLKNIASFIERFSLLRKGERVLVAYSGGSDSTALLIALADLGYSVSAAYINHRLRGQESAEEEKFVREFCKSNRIPLYVEPLEWKRIPSNLEEAARKKRYRHLAKIAQQHRFKKVALAHHRDDTVETFLLRLLRGAGMQGLAQPKSRRGIFIRPMLECSRSDVLTYLQSRGIRYFTDSSNTNVKFRRNAIRHELLPLLEKFNPRVRSALHRTASWIEEQNLLISALLQPYFALIKKGKNRVKIRREKLLELPEPLQKALLQAAILMLDPSAYPPARTRQKLLQTVKACKTLELQGFLVVESTEDWIQVRLKTGQIGSYELDIPRSGKYFFPPGNVHLKFTPTRQLGFERKADAAYVDAGKASFPLLIRNWKKGDVFRPLGMKGHKKLSDYLIDRKVPRAERKRIPLVFKEEELIWIAGHQISEDYRVTDQTKKVLRIELKHV